MKITQLFAASLFAFSTILFSVGCKQEPVIPDTPLIKFKDDIQPIMVGNCAAEGCHGGLDPKSVSLLTYDDVLKNGGIKAKDANGSKLYQLLKELGDKQMPKKPNPPLNNEQIELVYLWIMQGAKNN